MKAFVTEEASTGIEILRRSCGGHGYANVSAVWTVESVKNL